MPSMMKRPYRTRGRVCSCSDCQGTHGRFRAQEKRTWRAEAQSENEAEVFSGYWEDARRHLIESGYDPDVAASMAAIHSLNATGGRR